MANADLDFPIEDFTEDEDEILQKVILNSLTDKQDDHDKLMEARYLRQLQDEAYEQCLKADREREALKFSSPVARLDPPPRELPNFLEVKSRVIITDTDDEDEIEPVPATPEELRLARQKYFSKKH